MVGGCWNYSEQLKGMPRGTFAVDPPAEPQTVWWRMVMPHCGVPPDHLMSKPGLEILHQVRYSIHQGLRYCMWRVEAKSKRVPFYISEIVPADTGSGGQA